MCCGFVLAALACGAMPPPCLTLTRGADSRQGANICYGSPQTILQHNVTEGASGGVLNYFWQTGGIPSKNSRTERAALLAQGNYRLVNNQSLAN
eukprot:COSAG03_NODE_9575_length_709_cov_1.257377_2_plen_94_part_00